MSAWWEAVGQGLANDGQIAAGRPPRPRTPLFRADLRPPIPVPPRTPSTAVGGVTASIRPETSRTTSTLPGASATSSGKMSVGELAERVGITPANLAVLENGRAEAVRFATLAALCEGLESGRGICCVGKHD